MKLWVILTFGPMAALLWTYLHLQQMCLTGWSSLNSTTTQNRLCFERGRLTATAECVYYLLLQTRESVLIISPATSAMSMGKIANKHSSALPKDVTSPTLLPWGDAEDERRDQSPTNEKCWNRPPSKKVPGHKYPPFIIITKYQDI